MNAKQIFLRFNCDRFPAYAAFEVRIIVPRSPTAKPTSLFTNVIELSRLVVPDGRTVQVFRTTGEEYLPRAPTAQPRELS